MKRPERWSRFAGKPWVRAAWGDGTDRQYRPCTLQPVEMPAGKDPIAVVTCGAQDTLQSLAARYYRGVDRPEQLWWLIADVNGIVDPTLVLTGTQVVIPPLSVLEQ